MRFSTPFLQILVTCALAMTSLASSSWPTPTVISLPASVEGVNHPAISLNGMWKFTLTPPAQFWTNAVDPDSWLDLKVPAEPWMHGYEISSDTEYPYKKQIDVPAEFAGHKVFLRFDGVYSIGRVWVNGNYAGEHYGGFTSWQLDISQWVTPGAAAWITVGITDKSDDPSFASGYAARYLGVSSLINRNHRIGGILRGVTLFALPTTHLTRLHAETDFDESYLDAILKVDLRAAIPDSGTAAVVVLKLIDPNATEVPLTPSSTTLNQASPETIISIPVSQPEKWDSEHPLLYTLEASISVDDQLLHTVTKKIGFREIEMSGNRMLVNGQEVKLRGGNRHNVHPLAGRADVPELDERDIILYKEANINYIRTSHYPTTERFLDLCDQYGIYVEEEMAICWIDHHAAEGALNGLASSSSARPYFMTAISDTLERDRSHPSIIMWSIGNENITWGSNFEEERDYAHQHDPTRPLKTGHNHYSPGWNTDAYLDIDSFHYPDWNSNFDKQGKPYLFDEYCHVMTYYDPGSIAEMDPNIRNFWGESLKLFWDGIFPSSGSLGGAIWGTVDEVFLTPNGAVGYGRWGIFDGWRRLKPEYWLTKKGYSPIRIDNTPLGNPGLGNPLSIPVKNWFDHTDFNELTIEWFVGSETGIINVDLVPHSNGAITLPSRNWDDDDVVELRFTAHQANFSYLVDEYALRIEAPTVQPIVFQGATPTLTETTEEITVTGADFEIIFDKASGSIRSGIYQEELLLTGGPFLNLAPYSVGQMTLGSISARVSNPLVIINITGSHGSIGVSYQISIDGSGLLSTQYTITTPPSDSSSYSEVGIAYSLANTVDGLEWNRKGLYSVYPADHIGRNTGQAVKLRPGPSLNYRDQPTWSWSLDMKEFHQYGADHSGYGMTNDFRSSKEYIYQASAINSTSGHQVQVLSDGASHAVRMELDTSHSSINITDDRDQSITYTGTWSDFEEAGDYLDTETYSDQPGAYAEYTFTGTSVQWVSAKNQNLGKVDIYLDGELVESAIDAYAPVKEYQSVLYKAENLSDEVHSLRVVVRGDKNPLSNHHYVLIDGFSAVPNSDPNLAKLRFNINRHWAYDLSWGNYGRNSNISSGFSDTVHLRMMSNPSLSETPLSLQITQLDRGLDNDQISLSWPSSPFKYYTIQYSEDLIHWNSLPDLIPAQGPTTQYSITTTPSSDRLFLRVSELQ